MIVLNVRYDGEGEGESLDSGRQREEVKRCFSTQLELFSPIWTFQSNLNFQNFQTLELWDHV